MSVRSWVTSFALAFGCVGCFCASAETTLFFAGDSTLHSRKYCQMRPYKVEERCLGSWCDELENYLKPGVRIVDMALSGLSTRSFIEDGHWTNLLSQVKPGDWVYVQFGHNDQKKTTRHSAPARGAYRKNLMRFASDVRARGANPVFGTPMIRRLLRDNGLISDGLEEYPEVVRQTGRQLGVPVFEFNGMSRALVTLAPQTESLKWYRASWNGTDMTHLTKAGAIVFAQAFVEKVRADQFPLAVLFGSCCGTSAQGATLDETYTIVCPETLSTNDAFALADFNKLLAKALGHELAIAPVSAAPQTKCIYFGIPAPLSEPEKLTHQEHCVVIEKGDVYLFGGGVNGTRYAVYDFLQNVVGYQFFDGRGGVYVPPREQFKLMPLSRKRRFSFDERTISISCRQNGPEAILYLYRHGFNGTMLSYFLKREGFGANASVEDFFIPNPGDATIERVYLPKDDFEGPYKNFTKKYGLHQKKDHPEWFGKNPDGKPNFDLQCCFSEPGLRAEMKRRVFDRLAVASAQGIIDVSAGDHDGPFCRCSKCRKLVEKYGTQAGPLLDFFEEICPEAKKRWPDKYLMTLVYRKAQTQRPPKRGLTKMPDNFVARFAPIDDDFAQDWYFPANRETYADLQAWGRLCKRVLMWYYPNPYGARVTPPFGNVNRVANDIVLMHRAHTTGCTFEHDVGMAEMTGFTELQSYVMLRLFDDVTLDVPTLIDEFIEFEYGTAAFGVRKYLAELEDLRVNTPTLSFTWCPNTKKYSYLTPARLVRWNDDFDQMEVLVAQDSQHKPALHRLRFALDLAILEKYRQVSAHVKQTNEPLIPFTNLVSRIRSTQDEIVRIAYRGWRNKDFIKYVDTAVMRASILSKATEKPLPPEIVSGVADDRIVMILPFTTHGLSDDPTAAYGVAAVYDQPDNPERMLRKRMCYLYDEEARRPTFGVGGEMMNPRFAEHRGKYRFYKCAPMTLVRNCYLDYGTDSWRDIRANLSDAWQEGSFNRVDVWVSLKFEGPMYYLEDAGKPNRVLCDRVVVIRKD